jgi:hypothetical protein
MKTVEFDCQHCGGDGKETCDNPDHGFISMMPGDIGRIGCPGCGHDPEHKIPGGGKCEFCNGTGVTTYVLASEANERIKVLEDALKALYEHSRRSRFKADAYLWEQARAALEVKP